MATDGIWKPVGPPDSTDRWVGHDTSDRFSVYTRGNAGEVYPEVFTPFSFSVAAEAAEQAMRRALSSTGLIRPSRWRRSRSPPPSDPACSGATPT